VRSPESPHGSRSPPAKASLCVAGVDTATLPEQDGAGLPLPLGSTLATKAHLRLPFESRGRTALVRRGPMQRRTKTARHGYSSEFSSSMAASAPDTAPQAPVLCREVG
jgi:hypothetical protein